MGRARLLSALGFVSFAAAGTVAACHAIRGPASPAIEPSRAEIGADGGTATRHAIYEDERPSGRLVAFRDEADIETFEARWRAQEEAKTRARARTFYPMNGDPDAAAPVPAPSLAPPAPAAAEAVAPAAKPSPGRARVSASKASADTKSAGESESITNNQDAAVDEGDIVKLHKDHLVVLRRGRVFSISLKNGEMVLSKMLDAFGPEIDPRGTWYDEMVVEGDHVVVVGFSYARGGTEIGLFRINDAGDLTYRATYHLKSNDYYSARNYASRIVDGRLVFYAPMYLSSGGGATSSFPAFRRWKPGVTERDWVRTLVPTRLYHLAGEVPSNGYAAMHTVTTCDLREPELRCESTGILGPQGRVFYVSPTDVYVWMQDWSAEPNDLDRPRGLLAKLPIGRTNAGVTAVRVSGMPTDQFSFEQDDEGFLDVLVRSQSNGDAMFASESTAGAAALLRIPTDLFTDRVPIASARRYREVPRPDGASVQNRFVGPWLLYGAGQGYVTEHKGGGQLYAVRYASRAEPRTLRLEQGVDRIEPMGDDAVVVGSRGPDLVFSPIELGETARARRDYVRPNASQGELRSHGFFYKPASDRPREGVIGLPIRSEGARGAGYLLEGSASVLFLSNRDLDLREVGALAASPLRTDQDGCRASCVDWYGNARPIFAKGRIFALMGYELVEGRITSSSRGLAIGERARLSFAPRGGPPAAAWE